MVEARQKVTYSANSNSSSTFRQLEEPALSRFDSPPFKLSNHNSKNPDYMSITKNRGVKQVRPFSISQNEYISHRYHDSQAMPVNHDLTLPDIFTKDSLVTSEVDSDPSIFDIECDGDNTTNASPKVKNHNSDDEGEESSFLLKLERTLPLKPDVNPEVAVGMTTAYFGNKN